jgi:DNA end-binding protein Ku
MRPIWTGAIGFGLVNIPIKLFSAVQGSELNLDMLDKSDHSHIRFKRVNETTGKEVDWDHIVKAYDYEGKYVVLDDKDFEQASPEQSKLIDVFQFVNEEEIDSIYYENPYFLEPSKDGKKTYALLHQALTKSKKVGVGSFVMRNKEHLVVIKPYRNLILLSGIRFEEEIRNTEEIDVPKEASIKQAELKMAMALIDQLTEPFDITAYKDNYTESLLKVIKAKAKGSKVKKPAMKVVNKTGATDLMAQLKASLSSSKKRKAS